MEEGGDALGVHYLEVVRFQFERMKGLADRTIAQVEDEDLHRDVCGGGNAIAVVMRHMAGNMRSRFTDFLNSDGEKPSRDREGEFASTAKSRAELLGEWEAGWGVVFAAVDGLGAGDLMREVKIRGEGLTVMRALQRQVDHNAYHVGQIVMLGRAVRGEEWRWLSIPPGGSAGATGEYLKRTDTGA